MTSATHRAPGTLRARPRRCALLRDLVPERPHDSPSLAKHARDRALAAVIRTRLALAPVFAVLALSFVFFESTLRARATLALVICTFMVLSLYEGWRYKKHGPASMIVPISVVVPVIGQLLMASATGGLFSPLMPVLLIMVLVTGLLTELRTLALVLGLLLPSLWAFAWVHATGWPVPTLFPTLFGGAQALERTSAPWIAVSLFTLFIAGAARSGRALQHIFEALAEERGKERDRTLALHVEQGRVLATLTGEIAHELKNPLSSVKGLAALIAKDLTGRASERMAVLREEVTRMQTILDEFLNFSRPLVPLSITSVDLHELSLEVVRLHEGIASERDVTLEVEREGDGRLLADPRKIRQILINVLQNALDASPPGSTIRVRIEAEGKARHVLVCDQGPGLSEALGDRLFEVGATTKEHGSGIGLVVARSLARQHGGDLTLRAGAGSGTVARIVLPCEPKGVAA